MIRFALSLLAALALVLSAHASQPISGAWQFDAEDSTNGTAVSPTILGNGTHTGLTNSGWSLSTNAASSFSVSTSGQYDLPCLYSVDGLVTNAVEIGTRSLAINYAAGGERRYLTHTLTTAIDQAAFAFYFEENRTTTDFGSWDNVHFQNGSAYAVFQYRTYSTKGYDAHTSASGSIGSVVDIAGTSGKFWVTGKYDRAALLFTFSVYDVVNRQLVGTSSLAIADVGFNQVVIDNYGHGLSQSVTNHLDHFFIVPGSTAAYPLLPWDPNEFFVRADGSDSNSGRLDSAAVTGPTVPGGAWRTLGKAASSLTAGQYVRVRSGSYDETATFAADGTSGNRIQVIGDSGASVRAIVVTGDYVRIQGLTFTGFASNYSITPLVATDATGVEIKRNTFTNTGHAVGNGEGGGVKYGNLVGSLIVDNDFYLCGAQGTLSQPQYGKDIADYSGKNSGSSVIISHGRHVASAEYINPPGGVGLIIGNNVFGPTLSTDRSGTPHIDGAQFNATISNVWFGDNWHAQNTMQHAHLFLSQYGYASHVAIVRNVSSYSGDNQMLWVGDVSAPTTSYHYLAHNSIADSGTGDTRTINSGGPVFFGYSANCASLANVFRNVTTGATPYYMGTGGTVTLGGGDFMYPQGSGSGTLTIADPQWVDYAGLDWRPASGSPLIGAAPALTSTTASGTGTTVPLGNSDWFHDGHGLRPGSRIYVGDDNGLTIQSINHSTHVVTLTTSITYGSGDPVGFAYRGPGPDSGAYEYGDTPLSGATISVAGSYYTVTPTGDAAFVTFYRDGLELSTDYDAPFTATSSWGTITARVYAAHAQAVNAFTATAGEPASITVRSRVRGARSTLVP